MGKQRYDKNDTVCWVVIGLGRFGEIHADTLADMTGIDFTAFSTRRPNRRATVKWYDYD